MQIFLYDRENTIKAKRLLAKNEKITKIWHDNFAPSNKIGNCSNLFKILNPRSEKDFFNKYFEYAEKNRIKQIRYRGLTYDEFALFVNNYMKMGNDGNGEVFTYDTYFNDAVCHIITETYDGKHREISIINYLENKMDCKCSFFDGAIDATYGVDIKCQKGNITQAIQVKPISFFLSHREDVIRDQIKLVSKYRKFYKDYGIKTYYVIYRDDNGKISWKQNNNGGIKFSLKDLFDYDKANISSTISSKINKDGKFIII